MTGTESHRAAGGINSALHSILSEPWESVICGALPLWCSFDFWREAALLDL